MRASDYHSHAIRSSCEGGFYCTYCLDPYIRFRDGALERTRLAQSRACMPHCNPHCDDSPNEQTARTLDGECGHSTGLARQDLLQQAAAIFSANLKFKVRNQVGIKIQAGFYGSMQVSLAAR